MLNTDEVRRNWAMTWCWLCVGQHKARGRYRSAHSTFGTASTRARALATFAVAALLVGTLVPHVHASGDEVSTNGEMLARQNEPRCATILIPVTITL